MRKGGGEYYSVWKGTELSTLLHRTIPLNKKNANRILRTKDGKLLPWGKINSAGRKQTDLAIINQHTRSSRKITECCRTPLWELILETNPQIIKKFT